MYLWYQIQSHVKKHSKNRLIHASFCCQKTSQQTKKFNFKISVKSIFFTLHPFSSKENPSKNPRFFQDFLFGIKKKKTQPEKTPKPLATFEFSFFFFQKKKQLPSSPKILTSCSGVGSLLRLLKRPRNQLKLLSFFSICHLSC